MHQRTASAQSQRRDTPSMGSGSGTPLNTSMRPVVSRKVSPNTVGSGYVGGTSSPRTGAGRSAAGRPLDQGGRKRLSSVPITSNTPAGNTPLASVTQETRAESERSPSPGPAPSSSPSSDDESEPAQSRIIRRPPHFRAQDGPNVYDTDDDEDDEPAFHVAPTTNQGGSSDLSSTLRGNNKALPPKRKTGRQAIRNSQNSDSDTSSPAFVPQSRNPDQRTPGPLSPRRTAELTGGNVRSREGSDGTPSMGSSFSDLDGRLHSPPEILISNMLTAVFVDASVTQSALEEALASQLNRGGGSRLSTISQAFNRSRHWASGNN